jgi:D-ribose pyranase
LGLALPLIPELSLLVVSPDLHFAIQKRLGDIPIETVTHLIFKEQTRSARAVVRTGEFTPYANIILVAGVVF